MANEAAIAAAIEELKSQEVPNYSQTAKKWNIDRRTLARRYQGQTVSHSEAASKYRKTLTDKQEEVLLQHINRLAARGLSPTPQTVRNLVYELIKEPVGVNWVARFCKRHEDRIQCLYLRTIDQKRHIADNSAHFEHFYKSLRDIIEKYNITPDNIYNFDEKGFLIGLGHAVKRIIPLQTLKNRRIGAIQDRSREFISLLAAISADSRRIPPTLIYKGKGDLQDTWLDDFNPEEETAYFATSPNGWSNDDFGLVWLEKIFDRHTKSGRGRRLLILDGHSSHINMRFVDYADRNRILLVVLPPHSTHRLQPLDIGVFGPLSKAYTQEVDHLLRSGYRYTSMKKRNFWKLFYKAWCKALIEKNIKSGFEATGIYPLTSKQLKIFANNRPKTPPDTYPTQPTPSTPITAKSLRRVVRNINLPQSSDYTEVSQLIRASERLVIDRELLLHENEALTNALRLKRTQKRRGKGIGLFDKEYAGQAQFFSPSKVQQARDRIAEEEAKKQDKIAQAEELKLQRTIQKDIKAQEAAEKKAQRLAKQQLQKEAREKAKIEAAARREQATIERQRKAGEQEAQRLAKKAEKAQINASRPISPSRLGNKAKSPRKAAFVDPVPHVPFFVSQPSTSRAGRNIKPNTRLFS